MRDAPLEQRPRVRTDEPIPTALRQWLHDQERRCRFLLRLQHGCVVLFGRDTEKKSEPTTHDVHSRPRSPVRRGHGEAWGRVARNRAANRTALVTAAKGK